ncbi:hypothetical protein B446_31120 [Streptomyces collinus Tu 365]|uniref:Uncharacterized protein n=1 Tax=Streptomyces collinus (strain DSM 40733 / Tue 365) TaxID=1214242 RepID=S5V0B7_STRC3|nr:hypothetical protein B446_31120 [Streptomyces collinus Tu 365]
MVRLLEVAEPLLAGDPERGGTPDGRERGRAALEEAERALALPRPRVPEPDRQRWWAELSLWAAEIRYACGRGPGDLDTLISRLDAVHALATAARTGAEPEPERRELVDLTCELALNLAARWGSGERRELRSADADRVVALLRAVLDGPDRHLVADPTRCRTALGLVLSGRSRGPDHHTPGAARGPRRRPRPAAHRVHGRRPRPGAGARRDLRPGAALPHRTERPRLLRQPAGRARRRRRAGPRPAGPAVPAARGPRAGRSRRRGAGCGRLRSAGGAVRLAA